MIRLVLFLVLLTPFSAQAQELSDGEQKELGDWLGEARDYEKWLALYYNKVAKTATGFMAKERKQFPEPPQWLTAECLTEPEGERSKSLIRACELLLRLQGFGEMDPRRVLEQQERLQRDKPRRTSFWERVHFDGPGSMANSDHFGIYAIAGMHLTVYNQGRLYFYGPPGPLLIKYPKTNGQKELRIGYSWGASLRLFEIKTQKNQDMLFHLNMTKVWVFTQGGPGSVESGMDFVGMSISFKRR